MLEWASSYPSFWGLCASWTYMSISFTKLGKFSFIIFSNKFSISYSSSSSSGIPMILMLVCLRCPRDFLYYLHFYELLFLLAVLVECLFLLYIPNCWIRILSCSPSLLFPCRIFFISLSVTFISSFVLLSYSMISVSFLITNVLNSASDRLAISSLLRFFFLEF